MAFVESDLYEPIKNYFVRLGYNVRSEVKNCDVIAIKEDEMYIIELKKGFNLKLVYQALDRQSTGAQVYVAIPRPNRTRNKAYSNMLKLLRKLGIGLITVALDSSVQSIDVLLFPKDTEGRKNNKLKDSIAKEFQGRTGDYNVGGRNNVKINTAYRENCIKIACLLEKYGGLSARSLIADLGCEKSTGSILYKNNYGWFERIDRGVYSLTDIGKAALGNNEFSELVDYYRNKEPTVDTKKGVEMNEL